MELLLDGEKTDRLLFRTLLSSDFEAWLPFHEDSRTSEFWYGLPKEPQVACQQQFSRTFERYKKKLGGMNALILKSTENMIGLCGLLVQIVDGIKELEIAYSLLPEYWGRGFASEAAKKCKHYALEHRLADSLISIIQVDNIPSQKVALNNGMYLEKSTTYNNNSVHIFRVNL